MSLGLKVNAPVNNSVNYLALPRELIMYSAEHLSAIYQYSSGLVSCLTCLSSSRRSKNSFYLLHFRRPMCLANLTFYCSVFIAECGMCCHRLFCVGSQLFHCIHCILCFATHKNASLFYVKFRLIAFR